MISGGVRTGRPIENASAQSPVHVYRDKVAVLRAEKDHTISDYRKHVIGRIRPESPVRFGCSPKYRAALVS